MKEYMLYIKNDGSLLQPEVEGEFLRQCERYIEDLKQQGRLISAQPLGAESKIISKSGGGWK